MELKITDVAIMSTLLKLFSLKFTDLFTKYKGYILSKDFNSVTHFDKIISL